MVGGTGLVLPLGVSCGSGEARSDGGQVGARLDSSARVSDRFVQPLTRLPVLRPVRTDGNTDYYEVVARPAEVEVLPGMRTEIWGYNGLFPGPTIEARSGRRVVVNTRNQLPVPIVTHLHGGRTPPDSDGYPTDFILPEGGWSGGGHAHPGQVTEGTKEYVYPLEQRAATLWYHDHRMDFTGPQVWRGLVGMHILRDDLDDSLPLPKEDREIPLLVTDRSFDADGRMLYPSIDPELRDPRGVTGDYHNGVLGDVILVNGVPWPFLEVEAVRYRLRVLNASNARHYRLALDPKPAEGASFIQVGSDLGLLDRPRDHDTITMAPAERFDVVIDFSRFRPGTNVVLRNELGDGATTDVMQFRVVRSAGDESTVPATLDPDFEVLQPRSNEPDRSFSFNQVGGGNGHKVYRVEGREFDVNHVHADPQLGSTELWQFNADMEHPVHLHMAKFQVVRRLANEDDVPYATDVGWKDTVRLEGQGVTRVMVRFDGYRGKYVFHCHNLEHEDMGMMANFMVT